LELDVEIRRVVVFVGRKIVRTGRETVPTGHDIVPTGRDIVPTERDIVRKALEQKEQHVLVTVSARHMDVTPALKTFAEEKAGKLTRYHDRIQEIEVILDSGKKEQMRVEMIVNAEHKQMFFAHHDSDTADAYACIDGCVDKLERQLSDHHKKVKNRKHPG